MSLETRSSAHSIKVAFPPSLFLPQLTTTPSPGAPQSGGNQQESQPISLQYEQCVLCMTFDPIQKLLYLVAQVWLH